MPEFSKIQIGSAIYDIKDAAARSQIADKQDAVGFDAVPSSGSSKLMTSGAIYNALQSVDVVYTAGNGISITDHTITNTGIRTIEPGTENGTIKANGTNVTIPGLTNIANAAITAATATAIGSEATGLATASQVYNFITDSSIAVPIRTVNGIGADGSKNVTIYGSNIKTTTNGATINEALSNKANLASPNFTGSATLNGKEIATVDQIGPLPTNVVTSVNGQPGPSVTLTGSSIKVSDGSDTTIAAAINAKADISAIPTVPTNVGAFVNDVGYITTTSSFPAANVTGLATVATTGSYNSLTDKPTIPTNYAGSDSPAGPANEVKTYDTTQNLNYNVSLNRADSKVYSSSNLVFFDGKDGNVESSLEIGLTPNSNYDQYSQIVLINSPQESTTKYTSTISPRFVNSKNHFYGLPDDDGIFALMTGDSLILKKDNGLTGKIYISTLNEDQTYMLPNKSGTLALVNEDTGIIRTVAPNQSQRRAFSEIYLGTGSLTASNSDLKIDHSSGANKWYFDSYYNKIFKNKKFTEPITTDDLPSDFKTTNYVYKICTTDIKEYAYKKITTTGEGTNERKVASTDYIESYCVFSSMDEETGKLTFSRLGLNPGQMINFLSYKTSESSTTTIPTIKMPDNFTYDGSKASLAGNLANGAIYYINSSSNNVYLDIPAHFDFRFSAYELQGTTIISRLKHYKGPQTLTLSQGITQIMIGALINTSSSNYEQVINILSNTAQITGTITS